MASPESLGAIPRFGVRKAMIPVLVVSCDKRDWLWEPWARCWKNHAPNLGPVFLLVGDKRVEFDGVEVINTSTDHWGDSIRHGIEGVQGDRVLLMLDDFFVTGEVDWNFIEQTSEPVVGIHRDSSLYRSVPVSGDYRRFLPSSPYQASLQPTVWDVDVLCSCLVGNEGPWNFEKHGNARLINQGIVRHFLDADWYVHAVKKGKVLPEAQHLMGVA